MKVTPLGALTAANFAMLAAIGISQIGSATADTPPQILRGGGIEIVDAQGRLRASLTLQNDAADTVLFRLIDPAGQPSVKISASATAAGLSFTGGDDLSYIILKADGPEAELKLVEGEREQLVAP
jgi:hypothetical protein